MNKIIIRHGERVTEHVLDEHPLVVGRDPQCDLFFADKKLSRRHARFELEEAGVRLVDLGSRNGTWVNEERIDDILLTPSDAIRLGGLSISIEAEPERAPREDQESTVFLSGDPSADDGRTVVLSKQDLPDVGAPEEEGTVMLSAAPEEAGTVMLSAEETAGVVEDAATRIVSSGDEDPTLRRPETAAREAGSEQTMMLEGASPAVSGDTGTVIFRGEAAPSLGEAAPGVGSEAPPQPATVAAEEPELSEASDVHAAPSWQGEPPVHVTPASPLRFAALVAAVAVLAFIVLAMPLMRTLGSALSSESALRGRALVDLLAASNEEALRENRPESLVLERVVNEPGVLGAYILDPMGRILTPAEEVARERADAATPLLERLGMAVDAKDIRAFRSTQTDDGATVYARPVRAQGRRLGIAVLHYRSGAAASSWTAVMLLLGSMLLLMGVAAAVLMARRWTLLPVQELRDDVEALRRGLVESVAEDRPYSDLAMIARSFNELVNERGGTSSGVDPAAETYKPAADPTLVPEERERAEG